MLIETTLYLSEVIPKSASNIKIQNLEKQKY